MMTTPLISAYLVSVGILLMAAAHAAILARSSGHARMNWSFAGISLGFAFFQFFNALQYSAGDQASALEAHRWINFCSIVVIPLIAFAAASLDAKKRPRRVFVALAALAVLAIGYNFLNPLGYRFYALAPDQVLTLPWGEDLRIIQGQPTLVYRLTRLVSLCVMVYTMSVTFSLMRMKERLSSSIIWTGLAIMFITTALASMSDSGVIAMPYLGGFGFVFLAGAFSILLRKEMRVRELQGKRITHALAKEVQGRRQANERADQILHHDALTGLPNRAGLFLMLEILLELNRRQGTKIAVVLLDIDHLGAIKGTHGLATSDEI
ncbi:GGDEF domain-containing protein, partial [Uliginosibacterium flavum]